MRRKWIVLLLLLLFSVPAAAQPVSLFPYISQFIRTLLDDADAAMARATLGVMTSGGEMYVGRGDPATYDWTELTLVTDGAWHDLDLSPIVWEGATAVLLTGSIQDNAAGESLMFRQNGYLNEINIGAQTTQVANVPIPFRFPIGCDLDQIIEYKADNVVWDSINVVISGWWGTFDLKMMVYPEDEEEVMVYPDGGIMLYE